MYLGASPAVASGGNKQTIRVLLFTDEPIIANGLIGVFRKASGLKLAAISNDPVTLAETAVSVNADLVLLDMPAVPDFSLIFDLQKRIANCRTVLWVRTISNEMAYQAVANGVCGILWKTSTPERLLNCLRVVAEGGLYYEDSIQSGFLAAKAVRLTPREGQLVSLLAQGLKNKEIAAFLSISEGTVKVYFSRLFRKLGVKDRFELALYGLRNMPEMFASEAMFCAERGVQGANERRRSPTQASWLRSVLIGKSSGAPMRAVI